MKILDIIVCYELIAATAKANEESSQAGRSP